MKGFWLLVMCLWVAGCSQPGKPTAEASEPTAATALPAPVQALVNQGIEIEGSLDAPAGFHGYLARYRGQLLPVYLLPDGEHIAIGSLYDATGQDLTSAKLREAAQPALGEAEWKQLEAATWIPQGAEHPERIVYEFTDTECPYCHKLWEAEQPYLKAGKVQVRHIIVAVISPRSLPRAAAVLGAADPAAALRKHEAEFGHSPFPAEGEVPAKLMATLRANNQLMDTLGLSATPGIVYKDDQGKVRLIVGLPDAATIKRVYGD